MGLPLSVTSNSDGVTTTPWVHEPSVDVQASGYLENWLALNVRLLRQIGEK